MHRPDSNRYVCFACTPFHLPCHDNIAKLLCVQGRVLQRWRSSASGFGVDGLSEGEVEVMHLREENEALMDSLVRTKVDLAETEGDHLL